jgi:glycosyltransferase involved in cell wall biosynthesis
MRIPTATLNIVGGNPVREVRRLAEIPRVTLASDVPDVRPYLDAAAIAVFPLRIARRGQDEVLEALAMGKAVIATPVALEGLHVQSGVHLYSVATTDDWIAVTSHLLENPDLCTALGLAGRAYVEQNHRWELQIERFAELPLFANLVSDHEEAPTAATPVGAIR